VILTTSHARDLLPYKNRRRWIQWLVAPDRYMYR